MRAVFPSRIVGTWAAAFALAGVFALAGCAGAKLRDQDGGLDDAAGDALVDAQGADGSDDAAGADGAAGDGPVTDAAPADGLRRDQRVADGRPPADARPTPDARRPDSRVPDARVPDSRVPDTGPVGEVCDNAKDDDGNGRIDCVDLVACAKKAPCQSATRSIVIHEVYPGTPDYVVLRNASPDLRNVSGYQLEFHGTATVTFTLPSRLVPTGTTFAVVEFQDGTGSDVNTNANIPFYDGVPTASNAVILRNPSGAVVDYVGLGASLVGLPTGMSQVGGAVSYTGFNPATQAHYRAGMKGAPSTLQKTDWVAFTKSK